MSENKIIAGFWFRLSATILDVIILTTLVYVLTLFPPIRASLYHLGETNWIGSVILLLYFILCHSSLLEGQTLGKKILGIQMVRNDGVYLGLGQSFLRYMAGFYALPSMFIIGQFCDNFLWAILYVGIYLAILLGEALLLAQHPLKKGLSDMISGTLVTGKDEYNKRAIVSLRDPQQTQNAFILAGMTGLTIIAISGLISFSLNKILSNNQDQLKSIIPQTSIIKMLGNDDMFKYNFEMVTAKITQETAFQNVSFHHTYTAHINPATEGAEKANTLNVSGFVDYEVYKNPEKLQTEVNKLMAIIINNYGYLADVDYINVFSRSGFNIGIASQYHKKTYQFTADGTPITATSKDSLLPKEQISFYEISNLIVASVKNMLPKNLYNTPQKLDQ